MYLSVSTSKGLELIAINVTDPRKSSVRTKIIVIQKQNPERDYFCITTQPTIDLRAKRGWTQGRTHRLYTAAVSIMLWTKWTAKRKGFGTMGCDLASNHLRWSNVENVLQGSVKPSLLSRSNNTGRLWWCCLWNVTSIFISHWRKHKGTRDNESQNTKAIVCCSKTLSVKALELWENANIKSFELNMSFYWVNENKLKMLKKN